MNLHFHLLVVAGRSEHTGIGWIPCHAADTAATVARKRFNKSAILLVPYVNLAVCGIVNKWPLKPEGRHTFTATYDKVLIYATETAPNDPFALPLAMEPAHSLGRIVDVNQLKLLGHVDEHILRVTADVDACQVHLELHGVLFFPGQKIVHRNLLLWGYRDQSLAIWRYGQVLHPALVCPRMHSFSTQIPDVQSKLIVH